MPRISKRKTGSKRPMIHNSSSILSVISRRIGTSPVPVSVSGASRPPRRGEAGWLPIAAFLPTIWPRGCLPSAGLSWVAEGESAIGYSCGPAIIAARDTTLTVSDATLGVPDASSCRWLPRTIYRVRRRPRQQCPKSAPQLRCRSSALLRQARLLVTSSCFPLLER